MSSAITVADPRSDTPSTGTTDAVTPAAVEIAGVVKRFGSGAGAVVALDGISLTVRPGEFVCVVGASGCGKSTLLNLVAGLDAPTAGTVAVRGRVALMFQEAALLPWRTALQNVELPLRIQGVPKAERRGRGGGRRSCRAACASASPSPARSPRAPTCS